MSDMHVCLNGRMVRYDRARIAHDDAGFQHGVGLFETMAAVNGSVFRLNAHIQRMIRSADELGLPGRLDAKHLTKDVIRTVRHNGLQHARVRLTVTPGRISLIPKATTKALRMTNLVVANSPTTYDPDYFTKGISVVIARSVANPFDPTAGHKTLAYWTRLTTLRHAASVGAGETIWLNVSNHLASGAVSNLFLVKNDTLLTPLARGEQVKGALMAPVLPGITRAAVIDLADSLDLPVQRRMLDINDLLDADELFLTNSSWQMLPVTRVEKKQIGDGCVGPITGRLRTLLLQLIESETQTDKNN